ncbi:hypothetical protein Pan44_37460 [Caulifigura coniformis]|uniref:Uncharacterized protein n=1 Tax=Caulifigura coniformis TaxID=2527983 RepID=A0A517SHU3_9PLAN|nr:hypothetical protein [Caulifigura coniformis]QDT55700.1 hypothetical protein Pan44_37460 [Caulifigura coniformis]
MAIWMRRREFAAALMAFVAFGLLLTIFVSIINRSPYSGRDFTLRELAGSYSYDDDRSGQYHGLRNDRAVLKLNTDGSYEAEGDLSFQVTDSIRQHVLCGASKGTWRVRLQRRNDISEGTLVVLESSLAEKCSIGPFFILERDNGLFLVSWNDGFADVVLARHVE